VIWNPGCRTRTGFCAGVGLAQLAGILVPGKDTRNTTLLPIGVGVPVGLGYGTLTHSAAVAVTDVVVTNAGGAGVTSDVLMRDASRKPLRPIPGLAVGVLKIKL
jgi:hypothetical protein